jgi:hypothetical protein
MSGGGTRRAGVNRDRGRSADTPLRQAAILHSSNQLTRSVVVSSSSGSSSSAERDMVNARVVLKAGPYICELRPCAFVEQSGFEGVQWKHAHSIVEHTSMVPSEPRCFLLRPHEDDFTLNAHRAESTTTQHSSSTAAHAGEEPPHPLQLTWHHCIWCGLTKMQVDANR